MSRSCGITTNLIKNISSLFSITNQKLLIYNTKWLRPRLRKNANNEYEWNWTQYWQWMDCLFVPFSRWFGHGVGMGQCERKQHKLSANLILFVTIKSHFYEDKEKVHLAYIMFRYTFYVLHWFSFCYLLAANRCGPIPMRTNVVSNTTESSWNTAVSHECAPGYEWADSTLVSETSQQKLLIFALWRWVIWLTYKR